MDRIRRVGLAWGMLLLPATAARAYPTLQFEAWPTPASEICAAPCYQVRMFIEDRFGELEIQALQMDVDVRQGAIPALLPVPPVRNGNADSGNIQVRYSTDTTEFLPWNIASTVGRSPADGFDALMIHAANEPFTAASLAAKVNAPGTLCIDDPAKCDLLEDALARSRIYLGFFNVTRTEALVGGDGYCFDPRFPDPYCGPPPATPYFLVWVGNITGNAQPALNVLLSPYGQPPLSYVPFLPEPSPALLFACALGILVVLRCRGQ